MKNKNIARINRGIPDTIPIRAGPSKVIAPVFTIQTIKGRFVTALIAPWQIAGNQIDLLFS